MHLQKAGGDGDRGGGGSRRRQWCGWDFCHHQITVYYYYVHIVLLMSAAGDISHLKSEDCMMRPIVLLGTTNWPLFSRHAICTQREEIGSCDDVNQGGINS